MTTPIPIPADATEEQVQQLVTDAAAWLRDHRCPAFLPSGPNCQGGTQPHEEHFVRMAGYGSSGMLGDVVVRWLDPS